jgi:hypothetical protein
LGDKIKIDMMGGACSTPRRNIPIQHQKKNLKGKVPFGDLSIDRRIILKWNQRTEVI